VDANEKDDDVGRCFKFRKSATHLKPFELDHEVTGSARAMSDEDWLEDDALQGTAQDPLVDTEWTRLQNKYNDVSVHLASLRA
jgi:hypothetical protein